MTELQQHQELCRQFSTLLSYPEQGVREVAAECVADLQHISPEASASLEDFVRFLEANEMSQIEESFTGTFDLQSLSPLCWLSALWRKPATHHVHDQTTGTLQRVRLCLRQ